MIRSIRHRGLKRFFLRGDPSLLRADLRERIEVALGLLNAATSLDDLNVAGYRLHPLKGDMKGLWSLTISGNWRIVFGYQDGDALDVDLVDYHRKETEAMQMKNPPHPGRLVRLCLEEFGITVTEAAAGLGVTRQALNNVLSGKAAVSPEMAIRLSKAFGSTPDCWLRLQNAYDLARLREREITVRRYRKAS